MSQILNLSQDFKDKLLNSDTVTIKKIMLTNSTTNNLETVGSVVLSTDIVEINKNNLLIKFDHSLKKTINKVIIYDIDDNAIAYSVFDGLRITLELHTNSILALQLFNDDNDVDLSLLEVDESLPLPSPSPNPNPSPSVPDDYSETVIKATDALAKADSNELAISSIQTDVQPIIDDWEGINTQVNQNTTALLDKIDKDDFVDLKDKVDECISSNSSLQVHFAKIYEKQPAGTPGGVARDKIGSNIVRRELNTIEVSSPQAGVSLGSNQQFTLQPGKYYIRAKAPTSRSNRTRLYLYDVDNTRVKLYGNSHYTNSKSTYTAEYSFLDGYLELDSVATFEIRQYIETLSNTVHLLGIDAANPILGADEIYTTVDITRYLETSVNTTNDALMYACRAWCNFDGTGTPTIRGSGNIASVSRLGTGTYRVTFAVPFDDANYSVVVNGAQSLGGGVGRSDGINIVDTTTTNVDIATFNQAGETTRGDFELVTLSIFK